MHVALPITRGITPPLHPNGGTNHGVILPSPISLVSLDLPIIGNTDVGSMQGGQGALASVMEAAANVAASAKSGLDKTKAVVEEKAEKMSTRDPVEKDMATLRKEEKMDLAELRKCKAYAHNAIAASAAAPRFTDGGEFTTIGSFQQPAAAAAANSAGVVQYCRQPTRNGEAAHTNPNPNPTHTGMPAPVVEPDGVATGFKADTNTGSGTHFSLN